MFSNILNVVIIAGVILLVLKIISLPIKLIFKLLLNALAGFVLLFIIDVLSVFTGLWLPPTFLNAIIVGVLGLPGAGLLFVYYWLF